VLTFSALIVALVGLVIAASVGGGFSDSSGKVMANFDAKVYKGKAAFVVGYTGELGSELTRQLLESKIFDRVVLIGRRKVNYSDELHKLAEQKVVDFDKLDESKDAFEGLDVGFCCLGTTTGTGRDTFLKVDHDYVVNVARVSKAAGCKHFNLVTSQGTHKDSMFFHLQTKGLTEEHVGEYGFERLSIFRPAFMLCNRNNPSLGWRVSSTLLKPIAFLCPTWVTVPLTRVAHAMIANLFVIPSPAVGAKEVFENAALHTLGDEPKK